MNLLFVIDTQLFLLINHIPHVKVLDLLNLVLSGIGTAGIVWFVLGALLFIREEKKDKWFFVPLFLAGAGSWVLVEKIIKPLVARARPTVEMGAIIVGDGRNDFSFPSGHATIAWAMAVVLSSKEPKWRWIFYILAALISFSRIYLGKHYPSDVLVGSLLGWGIGMGSLWVGKKLKKSPLR